MIKSVDKTMRIISAVADGKGEPVSLGKIAQITEMPSPTVAHIVSTLVSDGYLIKVSRKSGYVIGPALHYLTRYGIYEAELVGICRPIMRWIERTTHATAVLSVIKSGRKFIIDYADDEQKLFAEHTRIRMGDIYRTATGRAILAEMERDEVAKLYNSLGVPERDHWKEVTSLDSLYEELAKIKKTRVVVTRPDDAEGEKNAAGYGSPLFRDGECIGAVGIAVRDPSAITDERDAELRAALKKAAREINRRLMYE
jgi:DNA-binding IclR family transcriptional regulator